MNRSSLKRHPARAQLRQTSLAVYALLSMLTGCAVYEPSLLSNLDSPLANGGEAGLDGSGVSGNASGGTPAGGSSSANAGDSAATDDAGAAGDMGSKGGAGAGDGAVAGSATAGGKGGSAQGGAAQGGTAQGGAAQGGAAQGGAAQGGSAQGGTAQGGSAQAGSGASAGTSTPRDLSTGKPAAASTLQTGNEVEKGNDGNFSTRWCGSTDTLPQWWRVDLGASHQLSSFSVAFQVASRAYTYDIETSPDDKVYTRRLTITGTGAVQSGDFPAGVSARYVRITVTHADPLASGASVWASFYEFSVLGI